jgi:CHAT domain-containing protein
VPAALLKSEVERYRKLLSDSSRAGQLLRGGLVTPETSTVTGKPLMSYVALAEMILPAEVRRRVAALSPDYVTVVPDGALHHLPLEALRTHAEPNTRFVLDDFPPIAYAPSITILKALVDDQPPARPSPTALTLGNPKFSTDPLPTAANVPPLLAANRATLPDGTEQRFAAAGMPLGPLIHAENEAKQLAAIFVDAFGRENVVPLIGEAATEARLRQELRDRSPMFLHLATHGLVHDEAYNLFGSIALAAAPTGLADPRNDSYLSLHEIHDLPLTGCELAALSACQTNVGPVRPLESGSTLARAFLSAGARRVISSHWQVADDSTAELIVDCFQRITDNLSQPNSPGNYAVSLQMARLRIRNRGGNRASPYHWAPFVLVGPAD